MITACGIATTIASTYEEIFSTLLEKLEERADKIVQLRTELGYSFRQIAQVVGIHHRDVEKIWKEYTTVARQVRNAEADAVERYKWAVAEYELDDEHFTAVVQHYAYGWPDPAPEETPEFDKHVVSAMERDLEHRAKLLGLYSRDKPAADAPVVAEEGPSQAEDLLLNLARVAITDRAVNFGGISRASPRVLCVASCPAPLTMRFLIEDGERSGHWRCRTRVTTTPTGS